MTDGGNVNKPSVYMLAITLDDASALIRALRQYYQLTRSCMPDACMSLAARLIQAQSELLQDDIQSLLFGGDNDGRLQ